MQSTNIESFLISFLSNRLSVPVSAYVPGDYDHKSDMVTVERDGGSKDNIAIDRPMITVQCWSDTRSNASKLAYLVDDAMSSLVLEPNIAKASRNSLYNFPDAAGNNRYQIVYDCVSF